MDDAYVSQKEHAEFVKRVEDENKRQNTRLSKLEDTTEKIGALTISVEKLAVSIEQMVKEQEQQGQRLQTLEGLDGEMWRKVVSYIATTIIGIFVGYIFTQIGM